MKKLQWWFWGIVCLVFGDLCGASGGSVNVGSVSLPSRIVQMEFVDVGNEHVIFVVVEDGKLFRIGRDDVRLEIQPELWEAEQKGVEFTGLVMCRSDPKRMLVLARDGRNYVTMNAANKIGKAVRFRESFTQEENLVFQSVLPHPEKDAGNHLLLAMRKSSCNDMEVRFFTISLTSRQTTKQTNTYATLVLPPANTHLFIEYSWSVSPLRFHVSALPSHSLLQLQFWE